MLYIFLLYSPPGTVWPSDIIDQHFAFADTARQRDSYISSEALGSPGNATTVRVRDGKARVTEGPFAETKEALGGLYILDSKDQDEALEYAAQIPGAAYGSVEVRPVVGSPAGTTRRRRSASGC